MISKKPLKGMKDVLPFEAIIRREVQEKIVETFIKNGYFEVSTPSLDSIELFTSNQGGDNEKIMFRVLKRGDKLDFETAKSVDELVDMGLRFDLTLPLSRLYANNLNELPAPFKCFQIGNVWRGERPQKGRYRQFTQCDVDIFGDSSINAEISLIKTIGDALYNVGFTNTEVKINNRILINELIDECNLSNNANQVMISLDKLDKLSEDDVIKEIVSKGINEGNFKNLLIKINELKNLDISKLNNYFKSDVVNEFIKIMNVFNKYEKFNIVYDPTLIRGMGYYTGTIFEVSDKRLGLSIAGGGRYDKLVNQLIGIDTPAVGFSIGFERIIQIILEQSNELNNTLKYGIIVDELSTDEYLMILNEMDKLQNDGYTVSLISKKKNLNKQIDDMKNLGFTRVCVYKGEITFKEL